MKIFGDIRGLPCMTKRFFCFLTTLPNVSMVYERRNYQSSLVTETNKFLLRTFSFFNHLKSPNLLFSKSVSWFISWIIWITVESDHANCFCIRTSVPIWHFLHPQNIIMSLWRPFLALQRGSVHSHSRVIFKELFSLVWLHACLTHVAALMCQLLKATKNV